MKKIVLAVLVLFLLLPVFAKGLSVETSLGVSISEDFLTENNKIVLFSHSEISRGIYLGWNLGDWTPHVNAKLGMTLVSKEKNFITLRPFTFVFAGVGTRYDISDIFAVDGEINLGFGSYLSTGHNFNMIDVSIKPEYAVLNSDNGPDFVLMLPVSYRRSAYYDSLSVGIMAGVRK